MAKSFVVTIQTKPYLKKYLSSLYGNPLVFSTDNHFGMCIAAFLSRPVVQPETNNPNPVPTLAYKCQDNKTVIRLRVESFKASLEIHLPKSFLVKRRGGFEITDQHTIVLNKLFETRFEEDLYRWCELGQIYKVEFKKNIEDFCWRHKITIDALDEDISYEALKKKEYRYRKKKEKEAAEKKVEKLAPDLSPQF